MSLSLQKHQRRKDQDKIFTISICLYQGEHQDSGDVCQPANVGTVDDIRGDNDRRPHQCRENIDYQ